MKAGLQNPQSDCLLLQDDQCWNCGRHWESGAGASHVSSEYSAQPLEEYF